MITSKVSIQVKNLDKTDTVFNKSAARNYLLNIPFSIRETTDSQSQGHILVPEG